VQRHVTSHGFALNCNTDLRWFEQIVPCGLVGKRATSLSEQCNKDIAVEAVVPVVENMFEQVFQAKVHRLEVLNPTLNQEIDSFRC
jgi:lipoate-protein ligase B